MAGIAIIGQGSMGHAHAKAWWNLGLGDDIRYICTPDPGAPFERAPSARFVTDLDEVLSDPDVDIVSVCTPTPSHADIATRALAAGKHVLLEKPIALTLDDANRIKEAATTAEGILMVAHVVRFFDGYRELRASVGGGSIGEVRSVRASRIGGPPGEGSSWWYDEAQSGGVVVDFTIHDFDQLNLFLGIPVAVTATGTHRYGPIETTVQYRDGGIGQVLGFMGAPDDYPFTSSIELIGTTGITGYQHVAAEPHEDPYTLQAKYFLDCVASGEQPALSPVDSAILALRVALAARSSLSAGGSATIAV